MKVVSEEFEREAHTKTNTAKFRDAIAPAFRLTRLSEVNDIVEDKDCGDENSEGKLPEFFDDINVLEVAIC